MNVHDTFCETLRLLGLNPHFILMDSATEKPVTDLTPETMGRVEQSFYVVK